MKVKKLQFIEFPQHTGMVPMTFSLNPLFPPWEIRDLHAHSSVRIKNLRVREVK